MQNFLSGHRKGPRPSTNTTSMYEKRTTHVTRTYSKTYRFIYIDSRTDILYYYTQLDTETGHTHTRTFHFIYIDSCTDILYYCTHLVQLDCTCVYTTVQCTLLYDLTLPKHTLVVHTLCSDQLYCCTFIL